VLRVSILNMFRYSECHYAECHYAECHYAECHYAECRGTKGKTAGAATSKGRRFGV